MVSVWCWGAMGRVAHEASGIHYGHVLAQQQQGEDGQNCCPVSHPAVTVRHETFCFHLLCHSVKQGLVSAAWLAEGSRGLRFIAPVSRAPVTASHLLWWTLRAIKHCAHQKEELQQGKRRQPLHPGACGLDQGGLKTFPQNSTKGFMSFQSP